MNNNKEKIEYRIIDWQDKTAHGLLATAYLKAKHVGLFKKIEETIELKMKKVRYSWLDKLTTLWASIVVGCEHTVEINDKLGSHERASAALFGLERFPDQSQINRLLWAFEAENIEQWRKVHLQLLCQNSRARSRSRWLELANHQRMLVLDLDQRAVVVLGDKYELAKKGYFGRKRGKVGYQLSLAFIGGQIGEVLDEYFDSGDTPIAKRIDDLLGSLDLFCLRRGIKASEVLIRGDGQLGTPANIAKIAAGGYHYLFKGISPDRAKKLFNKVDEQAIFWRVENGAQRLPRWMCDMGWVEHRDESSGGKGKVVSSRTLLLARQEWGARGKRPGKSVRKKLALNAQGRQKVTKMDYYLTDLDSRQLPLELLLQTYDDRTTIERYFYDEQYSLGAKQVRTHHYQGAAIFQFLVATTNNLLRWLKHTTFRGTELEKLGLGRLIRQAMQIPARIHRWGDRWIIELPKQHHLIQRLLKSWSELKSYTDSEQICEPIFSLGFTP